MPHEGNLDIWKQLSKTDPDHGNCIGRLVLLDQEEKSEFLDLEYLSDAAAVEGVLEVKADRWSGLHGPKRRVRARRRGHCVDARGMCARPIR